MIGPAPDLGGNVTVMPSCVNCSGAKGGDAQLFMEYGGARAAVGTPVSVCHVGCHNPHSSTGGNSAQVDVMQNNSMPPVMA